MFAVPNRKGRIEAEIERELLKLPLYFYHSGTICAVQEDSPPAEPHCGMLLFAGRQDGNGQIHSIRQDINSPSPPATNRNRNNSEV